MKQELLKDGQWRKYQDDITTDSLWISSTSTNNRPMFIIPKREIFSDIKNDSSFHGLFIPEIPYQFISRFIDNDDDIVWDCFAGSGTTHRVGEILGRKCISTDLTPKHDYIIQGDATTFQLENKAKLVMCHPPYHDIVKYSEKQEDGSNCENVEEFLDWLEDVAINIYNNLVKGGVCILVLGNIYVKGEELTLGVWGKDRFCNQGFLCKSHIIKDYGETKGSEGKNYNLNFYRQLKNGYNNFYGDNIFILKKK